jgi:uncharacterized membrane protein
MTVFLVSFLSSLLAMLAIDPVWLFTMSSRFYKPNLHHLMAETPALLPVAIFYIVYAFGLTFLVTLPAVQAGQSVFKIFLLGALFGFVAYATYDLTNQATLKDWPVIVSVVDMAWGALLTGVVSVISFSSARYFS